jgi:Type I phosphodiesterase / nucleotide pyrophosphatase
MIPAVPNYSGNFAGPSHSGPWDYLQEVPFVLHGPRFIKAHETPLQDEITLADFYPTVGDILRVDLPPSNGRSLEKSLIETRRVPKLIVVVIWDGVGRNVLGRWPDSWPTLSSLEESGTSYRKATVGSSPSITPATHSTLGTGTFPRTHGVTGIQFRNAAGEIDEAFRQMDPGVLQLATFADIADAELDNESQVGMLASHSWHLGMLGHGRQIDGGDTDQVALVGRSGIREPNLRYYSHPETPIEPKDMDEYMEEVDLLDGRSDGRWLQERITDPRDTPALVNFQTEATLQMLEQEDYGADDVPDLFFVNFKTGDTIGHHFTMDSPQMAGVIEAQDQGLADMVDYLDREVGDYVLLLTADHGHTPSPERSGGWPIGNSEISKDIDAHFNVPKGESLVEESVAVGLFLDKVVMDDVDVQAVEIASWLNEYTIANNWSETELPKGYEERGHERLFEAVFVTDDLPKIMQCAAPDEPGVALEY